LPLLSPNFLKIYKADRRPESIPRLQRAASTSADRIALAALHLSTGEVDKARSLLRNVLTAIRESEHGNLLRSELLAIEALISLARNDKDLALQKANEALRVQR